MGTLLDVGSAALTAIGQLGRGQTVNPEDGAQILRCSNLLLSKWTTQRLMLYNIATRTYVLVAMTADYTIGPTGSTFTAARPVFIESAQIQIPGSGTWVTLSVLDKGKWDAIRTKNAFADVPNDIWPEPSYPNFTFHVNPAPTGTPSIKLGCWEPLTQFVTLFDVVAFPPAYEEMLEANLAVMLAPYYDQPVPQQLQQRAADSVASVMRINAQGLGGVLGDGQTLTSPNTGSPIPSGPGGGAPAA